MKPETYAIVLKLCELPLRRRELQLVACLYVRGPAGAITPMEYQELIELSLKYRTQLAQMPTGLQLR